MDNGAAGGFDGWWNSADCECPPTAQRPISIRIVGFLDGVSVFAGSRSNLESFEDDIHHARHGIPVSLF